MRINPNLLNNAADNGNLGRRVVKVKRHCFASGTVVELREVRITRQDADGTYVTETIVEIVPPLHDGSMPENISDIAECANPECLRLVCASRNSETCPACGHIFCRPCMATTEIEGHLVRICRLCADHLTLHPVKKLFRTIKRGLWS